jgi:Domain of Unknown Function (DUF928)
MTVQPTRKFTRKLITALLAACLLPVALPMLPADAAPGYKPPRRQSAKRTENSGTRGQISRIGDLKECARDLAVPLTLIVPDEQKSADGTNVTPETTLEKPSLYVYLAAPNKQLQLSLYEGSTRVWQAPIPVKDLAGITEIAYPANQKGLEVGKTYTWKVDIVCELDSLLSTSKKVGSRVTRVPAPLMLQRELKTTTSPQQRAEIYARSGFWSETLMSIAEARQDNDTAAHQDLLALLDQVDLKAIADRERDSRLTPAPKPVVTPSPAAVVTPAPAVTPKPADPKKPCH